MQATLRVIGIDPGLSRTGYGVIDSAGQRLIHVACGVLKTKTGDDTARRLCCIAEGLAAIMDQFKPGEAAIEKIFVNDNAQASLKLGQARAVGMLIPAQYGLAVFEYAPNLIKKSVTGSGHAEKRQIRMMVETLLPRAEISSHDAADALAIAICHIQHSTSRLTSSILQGSNS